MPTSNSASNGFKIFCDEDPGIQSSLPPSTGEWQMPPTEPVIKRENTQKPGKWTDAKVEPTKYIHVHCSLLCIHLHTCTLYSGVTYLHALCTLQCTNNLCLVFINIFFGLQWDELVGWVSGMNKKHLHVHHSPTSLLIPNYPIALIRLNQEMCKIQAEKCNMFWHSWSDTTQVFEELQPTVHVHVYSTFINYMQIPSDCQLV